MIPVRLLPERYAVCQLDPQSAWPQPPPSAAVYSVTQTAKELSIVCLEECAPGHGRVENGWRVFEVQGPLPFSMTGVLSSLVSPLADARISIFAVSTFDTDYILVKEENVKQASQLLGIRP